MVDSGWERVRPDDVGPVVELALAGDLGALETLAALRLDADGWRVLAPTVVRLLRQASPGSEDRRRLLAVAAAVPLRSVQRAAQAIADSRNDPDRVAALAGIARYGLARAAHVRRLLRDEISPEVLAALPLEDIELDPAGSEIAGLREPAGTDDDRLWRAIAVARLGDLATLDRELDRLDRGESAPHVFDGSPWTAYEQLAAVRPLPPDVEAHLLDRPPGLVVWALTGTADAEGTPLDDARHAVEVGAPTAPAPSPAEAGAAVMRLLRAGGTPGDFVAGNAVVELALSFPALELPTVELFELCGRTAARSAQLAWLAGRSGLRRAAVEMAGDVVANPERRDDALAFLREIARTYAANPFEGSGGGAPAPPPRSSWSTTRRRPASPRRRRPRHRRRRRVVRRRGARRRPTAPPVVRTPNGTTPPGSPRRPTRGGATSTSAPARRRPATCCTG